MAHDRAVDHLLDLEFPQVRERGSPKTAAVMAPQPDVPEDAREDADRPKDVSGVEPSARHGKLLPVGVGVLDLVIEAVEEGLGPKRLADGFAPHRLDLVVGKEKLDV